LVQSTASDIPSVVAFLNICKSVNRASGSVVVNSLCYKTEGRGFETHEVHFFSIYVILPIYLILPATLGPGVYSASNRNEYQKQENNVYWELSAAGA
jgi:hypothetical protein